MSSASESDSPHALSGEPDSVETSGDTPHDVLDELKEVFSEKNEDYGNSWEKVGVIKRVMSDTDGPRLVKLYDDGTYEEVGEPDQRTHGATAQSVEAVVLVDTPENESTFQQNADDLITRLLDKLNRAYTLVFLKDEPALDNESTEDAAKDLTGYSSMLTSLIRKAKQ